MGVLKELPPEAAVLPEPQQWKYWFIANRVRIGASLLALCAFLRVVLHFEGHTEAVDFLKSLIDLFIVGSAATASAGQFKSNEEHEQTMNRAIKSRTGEYPAVHPRRRENDR